MLLEARVAHSVTEAEAVRLAREFYGLEAAARALPGEYDDNFRLTCGDARGFVLKVMHPAREQSFIDMQCRALRHLAPCAPQLPLPRLRRSVIYGDANDHNVLVSEPWPQPRKIAGLIDFGDMHHGLTTSEPAIAAAYAILGKEDPLPAAAAIVAGYHRAFPLDEMELSVLFALIGARLAVSVTNSAYRRTVKPEDPYVTVSEAPAWEALERLAKIHPRFAHYTFRAACGLPPVPQSEEIKRWLETSGGSAASIFDVDTRTAPSVVFDLSVGSTFLGAKPGGANNPEVGGKLCAEMRRAEAAFGVGRYDEPRLVYTSLLFGASSNATDERRTVHLGMDLFVEPGTRLRAPLDGVVHIAANNSEPQDYGPLVILRHETSNGEKFFTLYGHLTKETLAALKPGQRIGRGQEFARVGATDENGGWIPHVHFQTIVDLLVMD